MLTIALISASLFFFRVLGDCSVQPIYLDIHERNVEGSSALSYGAYVNVGSPEQELSLWPSLELNETTLADDTFCTTSSCSASSAHGLFDSVKSSSWQNAPPPGPDNTSVLTASTSTVAETGTDVLHLLEHFFEDDTPNETNLTSFPFQLLSNYTSNQTPFFGPGGLLGLGTSSNLLDTLVKTGKIASRSFGIYLGTAYQRADGSVNGSLTLGGYDTGRLQDPIQSFPLETSNNGLTPLRINVSQIAVVNATHDSVNILNSNNDFRNVNASAPENFAFDAYISTSQYEMTLPSSIAGALASVLNATVSDNSLIIPQNIAANLTIFIANTGLNITFNSTSLRTNPITFSSNGPYILGSSFLSSAYLAVSYDSTPPSFYLAPAVQDAAFIAPKALCVGTIPAPQTASHISFFVRNGLIGLIIGAGIGGSALSLLAFIVLREWRARRARKQIVRFVNLKRQEEGEEVELGNVHAVKMKASQVRVAEKMERERGVQAQSRHTEPEPESAMYFDPPPRRATVIVDKKRRKMGLKGILKVKITG